MLESERRESGFFCLLIYSFVGGVLKADVAEKFTLEEASAAHRKLLESGHKGKIVLTM